MLVREGQPVWPTVTSNPNNDFRCWAEQNVGAARRSPPEALVWSATLIETLSFLLSGPPRSPPWTASLIPDLLPSNPVCELPEPTVAYQLLPAPLGKIRQEPMNPFTRAFHDCFSSHFKCNLFRSKFKAFLRVLWPLLTHVLTPHSSPHPGGLTSLSHEHTFCVSTSVTVLVRVPFSSILVTISTQPAMPSSGPTAHLKSLDFSSPQGFQLADHSLLEHCAQW